MQRKNPHGTTDLIGSSGVSKADPRIEAIGSVDEAAAAIAWARSQMDDAGFNERLKKCQSELSLIMGAIAGLDSKADYIKGMRALIGESLQGLLCDIQALKNSVANPKSFILAGDTPLSAALDLARTAARRAERCVVDMYAQQGPSDPLVLEYMNKLSTLIYMIELASLKTDEG